MLLGLSIGAKSTIVVPPERRSSTSRCAELKLGRSEFPPAGENEKARVKLTDNKMAIKMKNATVNLPLSRSGFKNGCATCHLLPEPANLRLGDQEHSRLLRNLTSK